MEIKKDLIKCADELGKQLIALSGKIHNAPELGFEEYKAVEWLTGFLKKNGFAVKKGICNLPTAFAATFETGKPGIKKPSIAFIAEYDSLPGIGHGCGHNIIGPASCGAAIVLKKIISKHGISAKIHVIGTPAEEGGGGKVHLIERGAFAGIDAAMMIHPDIKTRVRSDFLANKQVRFHFYGKAAHAAASPHEGINALDAVILTFNSINAMRQQLTPDIRIHGVITDGGVRPNVIPDYCSCWFYVRSKEKKDISMIYNKVKNCAAAAAKATGCRFKAEDGEVTYFPMKHNPAMENLFRKNLEIIGEPENLTDIRGAGSSDIGNLSHVVPTIHADIKIGDGLKGIHTEEFCKAAISKSGNEGLIKGASLLAMTGYDLLSNPQNLNKVKLEFRKY